MAKNAALENLENQEKPNTRSNFPYRIEGGKLNVNKAFVLLDEQSWRFKKIPGLDEQQDCWELFHLRSLS